MQKTKIYIKGRNNGTLVKLNLNPDMIGAYSAKRRVELPEKLWDAVVKAAKKGAVEVSKSYTFIVSYSGEKELRGTSDYILEPDKKEILSTKHVKEMGLNDIFGSEHAHNVSVKKTFKSYPIFIERRMLAKDAYHAIKRNVVKDVFVKKLFTFNPFALFKERIIRKEFERTTYNFKAYATNPIPLLPSYNVYVDFDSEEKTITKTFIKPSYIRMFLNYFKH